MSRLTVLLCVAGICLVVCAISAGWHLLGSSDEAAPVIGQGKEVASTQRGRLRPPAEPAEDAKATSQPRSPVRSDANLTPAPGGNVMPVMAAASTSSRKPLQRQSGEPRSDSPAQAESVDPSTVVGRPFPVSASVEAGCKDDLFCQQFHELLRTFSEEPRDASWATEMESKLRDYVTVEDGQATIRGLECRTSLCLLEVTSPRGVFSGISRDSPLSWQLFNENKIWGYETDPTSARITVTVEPFTRR